MSLPKLCKRLGLRMSALLRVLAALGDTPIGGATALGYVAVRDEGDRRVARLAAAGRDWLAANRDQA